MHQQKSLQELPKRILNKICALRKPCFILLAVFLIMMNNVGKMEILHLHKNGKLKIIIDR